LDAAAAFEWSLFYPALPLLPIGMKHITNTSGNSSGGPSRAQLALGLFGLVAPVLTFFLAVSSLPETVKIFVLVIMALGYSFICIRSFQKPPLQATAPKDLADSSETLEKGLNAIGEASEFFGSSLKPSDLFRLVSSRVAQVFPFSNSALFVASDGKDVLQVAQADGPNAEAILQVALPIEAGIAGMAWLSNDVEVDTDLKLERAALPERALADSRSAVAIPLRHDGQAFAILVLYTTEPITGIEDLHPTFEAIGERVAPLFLSSISFDRSISNALTDTLTCLPNERAFYMVLENQLAESQRFRTERPLTVLTIDIKNFADANQSFGFAAGDRILSFTAEHLTSQLRKMDFLSRSSNDEFLIILPTATAKFAAEIIDRIRERFATVPFTVSDTDEIKVWLNFGWATFWQDGETAEQLLQNARVRKQQAKAEEPAKVLWFPKEYVN
jgi:diguanylate cyclase (GGDEF)-like protein